MIIKHPRFIIKQHGAIKHYRYVGDVSVVRHHVSEEDENVRRYMVVLEGRFFRDLTGAMIL